MGSLESLRVSIGTGMTFQDRDRRSGLVITQARQLATIHGTFQTFRAVLVMSTRL